RAPEKESPAPPTVERQRWDHTPYENRSVENKARALELHGGDDKTEEAVARGLAYLARVQQREGNWGRADARDPKYGQIAVGKTGLALLAFLGAGHTHRSGTLHSGTVLRAVQFLSAAQDPESGHLGEGDAYSHGIATYALAECLAMTHDAELLPVLEKAVARILAAQDSHRDPRLSGGWSYYFADGHAYDRWPRTAITAWQVMALESARLSGITVPDSVFEGARAFLSAAREEERAFFLYDHDPERLADRYSTLPASTPAGMFALSLLGADLASEEWGRMRAFVLERRPDGYRYVNDDEFVFRGTGNLYFWYYGTLAMFRAGGVSWKTWNAGMKATLVPAQAADGSWSPIDPYARYARDDARDKSYTTALCVLSLEIYYRYYLPLLKVK
ncbi:MAG: terpene cyclase/mutase family protein, partial [Planctomycetes bacterium]|nr:terpene cyclase/mutase family protein [Planctomycetota bacterium]